MFRIIDPMTDKEVAKGWLIGSSNEINYQKYVPSITFRFAKEFLQLLKNHG